MHQQMLDEISEGFLRTAYLTGRKAMQPAVAQAMRAVRRHEFVPTVETSEAYVNRPAVIGYGQTISQPYIVAIMTDLIDLKADFRVLEIGTGSGYQAAVLAEIVNEVYSIEIVEPLAHAAADRLKRLGYDNVKVKLGDGNYGWPEAAPFDAIMITAGGRLPPKLTEQLKPGGRLVVPINQSDGSQQLTVLSKGVDGSLTERVVLPVRFVPLTGDN
jgi:protein-L-isoaspartate(D-aspartate) O-methyltransferase